MFDPSTDEKGRRVSAKHNLTEYLGAGYHRGAFPATTEGGKRRVVVDKASSMARVTDLLDELTGIETQLEQVIGAALTAGASWADVGGAMGITRQGASQRFRGARRAYMALTPEDRERVDRLAGVATRRITFEVRDDEGQVSSHNGIETARKAGDRWAKTHTGVEIWKIYPAGREVFIENV